VISSLMVFFCRDLESELLIVGSYYIMKNVASQPDEVSHPNHVFID